MSYLVTGGVGSLGAHIVRQLTEEGERIIIYDINSSRDLLEILLDNKALDRLEVVRGDICDLTNLIHTAQKYNIQRIIHTAAILSISSSTNPYLAVQVNCCGTVNILETARILGLKKVVLAGSGAVFGSREKYDQEYLPNDAAHMPETVYGACKSLNEKLSEHYFAEFGVDNIVIRYSLIYSAWQKEGASAILTRELIVKPARGEPGSVPYAGRSLVNWQYVEDAARAAVMASKTDKTNTRAFNISGYVHSISEVAEVVKKLIPGAQINTSGQDMGFVTKFDTSRIENEIGFHPSWTIEKSIAKIIDETRRRH